ncbi:snf2 family helicase [Phlyctema vagabunda]|uniref:Snf2 family helicase n=1 Tax=Phlyctema vagabunda TaxID=108571 RepID=A0ABR4P7K7_9HELO
MASSSIPFVSRGIEPPRKRQRLWQPRVINQLASISRPSVEHEHSPGSPFDTSFRSSSPDSQEEIPNISKYIPVGCLRIQRQDIIIEDWELHSSWAAFARSNENRDQKEIHFLSEPVQQTLTRQAGLANYNGLLSAGWARFEFKSNNKHCGQIRVYILPDDVSRRRIDRDQPRLRSAMKLLLALIDISGDAWHGGWQDTTPVLHVNPRMNDGTTEESTTLFEIFNTLPSPAPNPDIVSNHDVRNAMQNILSNEVQGVTANLYEFQMRSAALMLQREAQPSQIIDPRLISVVDQYGGNWYYEMETGICLREPRFYEAPRGGICAETMGYGKTLICLALILATRDQYPQIPVEYSVGNIPIREKTATLKQMCAAAVGRTSTSWKPFFSDLEDEGYDYTHCTDLIKASPGHYFLPGPPPRRESRNPVIIPSRKILLTPATLVIVPANLVEQWVLQIKVHTTSLKYLVMDSSKKQLPPAAELAEYDIILFSKQRFDKEAKDGSDQQGRRETTSSRVCRCPYIGATRDRNCICFQADRVYRSPLKELHFKRIITDEGHTFGNSSNKTATEGITVVDYLQVSARWIISGTPTPGLHSKEVTMSHTENESANTLNSLISLDSGATQCGREDQQAEVVSDEALFFKQERKDLEKLGHIAKIYLKARPWANAPDDYDSASWTQYVMQPRHGSNSHGNMACLRATLESMIIRHRIEDVEKDIKLPPMHQKVITLEGSSLDNMSLNTFSLMITSNAITSERKDADYLFHPKQRKALQELVSNLRQASFFWSGYTEHDVKVTIDIAEKFLENKKVPVSSEDETLLFQALEAGKAFLSSKIVSAISRWHEMPMVVHMGCDADVRKSWSLLENDDRDPTLIGATMLYGMQKFITGQLWKEDPAEGLEAHGTSVRKALHEPISKVKEKSSTDSKTSRNMPPTLAGGVAVGDPSGSMKRPRTSTMQQLKKAVNDQNEGGIENGMTSATSTATPNTSKKSPKDKITKSALKNPEVTDMAGKIDPASPLASASILSTASAKLSYLIDNIVEFHKDEKILVFYEADNVAYYIAEALECLGIKHLIYAKTLTSARRSQYVVTFNRSDSFRVLLMDVSQAAYGLDLSSASRVFFVNPVFSPQVEAQAVKRAHRIGQKKPVFVETLVLKGSIEEVILARRGGMSEEEHIKCKSILDDQTMYDWIRNVRFLPIVRSSVPEPEQMAKLSHPQKLFEHGNVTVIDPDADLISNSPRQEHGDENPSGSDVAARVSKGKQPIVKLGQQSFHRESGSESTTPTSDANNLFVDEKKKRKRVGFASLPTNSDEE